MLSAVTYSNAQEEEMLMRMSNHIEKNNEEWLIGKSDSWTYCCCYYFYLIYLPRPQQQQDHQQLP